MKTPGYAQAPHLFHVELSMDHPHKCEHKHSLSSMEIMVVLGGILIAAGEFSLDGGSIGLLFTNLLIKP